ncbi:hypothetical protein IC220_05700 [Wolbachia endosymbiont of Pentalonia nigronervosa]|jgi:hypothetical protein|uniref:hypothetical protein n=1 Tax=Wolbachia endosymbiont of Pentalonia nigronervosa TaxID=1301914 RepID=UPI00165F33D1|nr:hypothetical protein [Wolbachia endosymbiont of Pentalonia nigronervosa]MBD0391923.1 hypothetical protein [Wolbachia endosymbiont of Pentalonia nigronervosa]
MLSKVFEDYKTRKYLLDTFSKYFGVNNMPYTNIPNMGLWATYMSKIGINPNLYAPLRHALIECSFFNIAFDGKDIDYKELINQEQQAIASNIDCLMIPCIRENNIASLLNKGYIPIPSFFNSIVKLSCEWQVHLKNSLSSRSCRDTMNEIREIEQNYVTEWIPLKDIVRNKSILTKIVGLYIQHAQKFDYPAIMYTQEILEHLENSIYSQYFYICLIYLEKHLVYMSLSFVDFKSSYFAFLVVGINRLIVPHNHNLYKYGYIANYKFMQEQGLTIMDMTRGFVKEKIRMGANKIDLLYTYLKPLTSEAKLYVSHLKKKSEIIIENNNNYRNCSVNGINLRDCISKLS